MPATFAGFPIVGQSKNFLITADDNTDANKRAAAIAQTCESDLSKLEKLFNTNFQVGDTHAYTVWVHVPAPGSGGGASNYGFERDQSSRIFINGTFNPVGPPNIPPDALIPRPPDPGYIRQEYARFLFVAELAEILMDFTGGAWGRGDSSGEGLSIFLGTLLHPDGYYGAITPRVNSWLNTDRPNQNWVGSTEPSDTNTASHGCALLFLYYMVNQLGFPIERVIGAYRYRIKAPLDPRNGWTLSDTFAELTGQPASAAFTGFNGLITKHIPAGQKIFVGHDNIFPLRDPAQRTISLNQASRQLTHVKSDSPESFVVHPGLFCEKKGYDFFRISEADEYAMYANCRGILNAAYKWKLNGQELSVRNTETAITLAVEKTVRTPDDKKIDGGKSIDLHYIITDSWNKSILYFKETDILSGNCVIKVTVSATEAAINDAPVQLDDHVSIDTISFEPGAVYIKDRKRCNPFYARIDDSLTGLSATLANLKNRPDPPGEKELLQVINAVARVESDAQAAAKHAGTTSKAVLSELRFAGVLLSGETKASPEILRTVIKGRADANIEHGTHQEQAKS